MIEEVEEWFDDAWILFFGQALDGAAAHLGIVIGECHGLTQLFSKLRCQRVSIFWTIQADH
jgi:hypothetical protein